MLRGLDCADAAQAAEMQPRERPWGATAHSKKILIVKLTGYLKRSWHGVYYYLVVGSRVSSQQWAKKPEFSVTLPATDLRIAATLS